MDNREKIIDLLKTKSSLKQGVFKNTKSHFEELIQILKKEIELLQNSIDSAEDNIRLNFKKKGEYEARVTIGSDVLIFHQHSNIFKLDQNNPLWKSSYLKDNPNNGYCGVINIYNFLFDSINYDRTNDLGYLIGRVFINKEGNFMVEGKAEMGLNFRDFMHDKFDEDKKLEVIQNAFSMAIDFDLLMPPYDKISMASVHQVKEMSSSLLLKTGKRLGFQFNVDAKTEKK